MEQFNIAKFSIIFCSDDKQFWMDVFPDVFHGEDPETVEQKVFRVKLASKGLGNLADSLIQHVHRFSDLAKLGCVIQEFLLLYRKLQTIHRAYFPEVHLDSAYDRKGRIFHMELNIWYDDAIFLMCGIRDLANGFCKLTLQVKPKRSLDQMIESVNDTCYTLQDLIEQYSELQVQNVKMSVRNKKKSVWKCQ